MSGDIKANGWSSFCQRFSLCLHVLCIEQKQLGRKQTEKQEQPKGKLKDLLRIFLLDNIVNERYLQLPGQ